MTYTEMYLWMANPSLLAKSSLPDLKQMVDDYPYFHAARMLYLKNLEVLQDVRLEKELKKMAIFIPDRKRLFILLEEKRFKISQPQEATSAEDHRKNRTEEAIVSLEMALSDSETLEQVVESAEKQSVPTTLPSISSDYIHWLEANAEDLPTEEGMGNKLRHQDLIDSFIANDKHRSQRMTLSTEMQKTPESGADDDWKEEKKVFGNASLDDSYFTETLARVYYAQKRYDKALEIIRVLNLKYPKKNAYFADQIRYLERIINLKK